MAGKLAISQDNAGQHRRGLFRPEREGTLLEAEGQKPCHYAGARCDVHVDGELLRFWVGDKLVKTAARTGRGEVRN